MEWEVLGDSDSKVLLIGTHNMYIIGPDKSGYQGNIFFLFLQENICCGCSLEVPW